MIRQTNKDIPLVYIIYAISRRQINNTLFRRYNALNQHFVSKVDLERLNEWFRIRAPGWPRSVWKGLQSEKNIEQQRACTKGKHMYEVSIFFELVSNFLFYTVSVFGICFIVDSFIEINLHRLLPANRQKVWTWHYPNFGLFLIFRTTKTFWNFPRPTSNLKANLKHSNMAMN